ncbi:disease resistance protein RPM1-like [Quercus suber]|uniref:disease resistance protein RPM1-like n=1 Tax=Quercus suber TaxID=58331 RepID=UPI000CE1CDB6|nr:disease resistance protein RPM1-like [Quercus suber]
MAESAFSLVIHNLVPLLAQEAKLLKGIHEEVKSIIREIDMIQSFLKDADIRAEKDHMDNVAKTRVKQVREEAYHIEDVIDEYILHFAKQPHGQRQCFYFLRKVFHIIINLKARHVIASEIQGMKVQNGKLENIKKNGERYGSNVIEQRRSNSDTISNTWHDPRIASLLIEEAKVVGIESYREKLINWLVEGPSNRMVISTFGIGGLGKTTLVKKVYENDKVRAHFDCHAWITVSQSYKMEELLRNMIKQLYKAKKQSIHVEIDTMKQTTQMEQIRLYLHEHRYAVVFDDVWKKEFWGYIELALPKNEKGSRILITSRNEDLAPSNYLYILLVLPLEKAWELFCKKVFQREKGLCPPELVKLSCAVVERCEGLPLAIVAIGGLLSTKDKIINEIS